MLARDLAWALDPVLFAKHLGFHPDPSQARVLQWTGQRLLLNCTRQWGKSTTAAIVALHRALYHPNSLILLISPSLRQFLELFRKVTVFLNKVKMMPEKLEDKNFSLQLANGSRIVALPSNEATVRGFSGVNLIIEDEASRVDDLLYRTMRPMLAVSGGRLILMSTPFGKRGHFFEEWTNGGSAWERIECKAPDCPRIPQQFLEEERASMLQVKDLHSFPPGTGYKDIVKHIYKIMDAVELTFVVVDQTAVGKPIVKMYEQELRRSVSPVIIGGRHLEHYADGLHHIPKQNLVSGLIVSLAQHQLRLSKDMAQVGNLTQELIAYENRATPAAQNENDWREQPADDLVFAVGLACWKLQNPPYFLCDWI